MNLPFAELAPEGRFLPPEELRARFEAAGAASGRELVAYCGSGVTACVVLLAAEVAGLGAAASTPARGASGRAAGSGRAPLARALDVSRSSGPGGVRSA